MIYNIMYICMCIIAFYIYNICIFIYVLRIYQCACVKMYYIPNFYTYVLFYFYIVYIYI